MNRGYLTKTSNEIEAVFFCHEDMDLGRIQDRDKFVSLLAMLGKYAFIYSLLSKEILQNINHLKKHQELNPTGIGMVRTPDNKTSIAYVLSTLNHPLLENISLPSVRAQIERVKTKISKGTVPLNDLLHDLQSLYERLEDDLESENFLHVKNELVHYYEYDQSNPLFGLEVESKLPRMSEDIVEAGKCLALNRSTASVFHLMRVMEIAVQILGEHLGIQLVNNKPWQNILDEVNKAIKVLDQKSPQAKLFAELASHLYNVKVAWRNEVMHPKQTYTQEEAETILRNVSTFVKNLAQLI